MAPPWSSRPMARKLSPRRLLLGLGTLYLLGALFLLLRHALLWLAVYLLLSGGLLIGAILFERRGYRGRRARLGDWQPTGERFVDPTTRRLVEVYYDPTTGARDYVEVEPRP